MTGPEHYREAERAIEHARTTEDDPVLQASYLAEAQVHATLALATPDVVAEARGWI
jgi:hypothetical protein